MRPVNIRERSETTGIAKIKASFRKNWIHYLQEALGLAIFMFSACFFGGMLQSPHSGWQRILPGSLERSLVMGVMMGGTALFIFYGPWTAPSGSHINPAVTVSFFRLKKMEAWDTVFYILFQFAGGTAAVYLMGALMGTTLTSAPVNYMVTVPGRYGTAAAALMEFIIAFVMMGMVLFTSSVPALSKYTRLFSGCLVCIYVIIAGPVSGFGMNPARSFASAQPAHIYRAFWIYLLMPFAGMLLASECFLLFKKYSDLKTA